MYWILHSKAAAEKHLTAGAKRVVISAPGGNDVPMERIAVICKELS
jgi:glyceraldehyde-3-phosphate dehydrogenase/erythrose-4-phosphate dehydrogenase